MTGIGAVLTGCFYVSPINRQPRLTGVQRQCDGDPSIPCNFDDLHHGDLVRLTVQFTDPEHPAGDVGDARASWRISACDRDLDPSLCDLHRLYDDGDGEIPVSVAPSFTVRRTLETTGGPVRWIDVVVVVFDDRGASSSYAPPRYAVHDGPTLVLRGAANTYLAGAPIDLFATYGDPDDDLPANRSPAVTLTWTLVPPGGQPLPDLIDLEVSPDPTDPAHVAAGKRFTPSAAGVWEVSVVATDAHGRTNRKSLQVMVEPAPFAGSAPSAPVTTPDRALSRAVRS